MDSPDCMDIALSENRWTTGTQLLEMSEADKKTKLMQSLNKHLNSSIHTVSDLSITDVILPNGGQCGMAAMYNALYSTVLTKTQLSTMSYSDMKNRLLAEMGQEEMKWKDKLLLRKYNECRFLNNFCVCYEFQNYFQTCVFQHQTLPCQGQVMNPLHSQLRVGREET